MTLKNSEDKIGNTIEKKNSNSMEHGDDDTAHSDQDDRITVINHKKNIQNFIEKSTLGIQFSMLVLFQLARQYGSSKNNQNDPRAGTANSEAQKPTTKGASESFSFTSKEFFDEYSRLAYEMGLTKYLVRPIAFQEFILTLEYLCLIREHELTGRYEFRVSLENLKWLASIALQLITGGQRLSSPEIFYSLPPIDTAQARNKQSDESTRLTHYQSTNRTADLIKDITQAIFTDRELELERGRGTSKSIDDVVRPRSRDYGEYRPYFQHRFPPTIYSFRKPNEDENKRIWREFAEGQTCTGCGAQVMLDYFDIWIGEPLESTPSSISDQRMTDVLAGTTQEKAKETTISDLIAQNYHPSERELLTFSYGIIPMDGNNAFIAFAKPKQACPYCGTNPANFISLSPQY